MIIYKLFIFLLIIFLLFISISIIYIFINLIYHKQIEKFTTVSNPNLLVIDASRNYYKLDNGNDIYTHFQYFYYTGSIQEFNIPDDTYTLNLYIWGAGGGGNIHNKTINKPYAMYISDDYVDNDINKYIPDTSGNNRGNAIIETTGTINKIIGQKSGIYYLSGDISTTLTFSDNIIPENYTILSITRYKNITSDTNKKILTSSDGTWYQGHDNHQISVSYNGLKTLNGIINIDRWNDWIVCIGKNETRTTNINKNIIINGKPYATSAGGTKPTSLGINIKSDDKSEWNFASLIIWDSHLTDTQIDYISDLMYEYIKKGGVFNKDFFINIPITKGGDGGYVRTYMSHLDSYRANNGNKIKIVVGKGGDIRRNEAITDTNLFGKGGIAKTTSADFCVGCGGGLSGLFEYQDFTIDNKGNIAESSIPIAIAGGGGGAGIGLEYYDMDTRFSYEKIIETNPYISPIDIQNTNDVYLDITQNITLNVLKPLDCDILLVGGGGSGGSGAGGGGGGGEVIYRTNYRLDIGNYNFTIGNGGLGTTGADGTESYIKLSDSPNKLLRARGGKKGLNDGDNGGNGGSIVNIKYGGIGTLRTAGIDISDNIFAGGGGAGHVNNGGNIAYTINILYSKIVYDIDVLIARLSQLTGNPYNRNINTNNPTITLIRSKIAELQLSKQTTRKYSRIISGNGGNAYRCNIKGTIANPNLIYLGSGGSGGIISGYQVGTVDIGAGIGGIGNNVGANAVNNTGSGGGGGGKVGQVNKVGGNGANGRIILRINNFKNMIDSFITAMQLHGGNGGDLIANDGTDYLTNGINGKGGNTTSATGGISGNTPDSISLLTKDGGKFRGGDGNINNAGGGSGYYGGGRSGYITDIYNNVTVIGGGGGGSSFINTGRSYKLTQTAEQGYINSKITQNGSSIIPWLNEILYLKDKGIGGINKTGNDGLVVIEWFKHEVFGRAGICSDGIKEYVNNCASKTYISKISNITNIDSITNITDSNEENGGYIYTGEGFIIRFSSYHPDEQDNVKSKPLYLFDGNDTTYGIFGVTSNYKYNSSISSGSYAGNSRYPNSKIGYTGEWIEITLTTPIILGKYTFRANKDKLHNAPGTWYLYGITDGNDVVLIHYVDVRISANTKHHNYYERIGTSDILEYTKYYCNNNRSYSKYVFIITGLAYKYGRDNEYDESDSGILKFLGLNIYELG